MWGGLEGKRPLMDRFSAWLLAARERINTPRTIVKPDDEDLGGFGANMRISPGGEDEEF